MRRKAFPSYRHHRGSGQAVVTINGKDHYLGLYGTPESRERYERMKAQWVLSRGSPKPPATGCSVLVKEVLAAYLEHAGRYYVKGGKPTGQLRRIVAALRPLREKYGSVPVSRFGLLELKTLREEMVARGWTRKFVNSAVAITRACWRWAEEERLIPAGLWAGLAALRHLKRGRTPAPDRAKIGPVALEHVERTLPELPPVVADMVRVELLTGMRPCEVTHLRAGDLDRQGRLPSGEQLPGLWIYTVRDEGNKLAHHDVPRYVLIGPKAQAVLAPYVLRKAADEYIFDPREAPRAKERGGAHYSTESYNRAIARACRGAKVPGWSANQLRHYHATELHRLDGLKAASAALGHQSLETTLIYVEGNLARAAEATRRIG